MHSTRANESHRCCPYCAERVNPAAKVCPRCRQWLSWRSLRNPWVNTTLSVGVFLACVLVLGFTLLRLLGQAWNPPPYYSDHPDALALLDSQMNWVMTKDGPRIYVTGILTNRSAIVWRDVEFQCRFFDRSGKLIDAASPRSFLTIRTNDDVGFRANVLPTAPTNQYDSFKLTINNARYAQAPF